MENNNPNNQKEQSVEKVFLQEAPFPACLISEKLFIRRANKAFLGLVGYGMEEISGEDIGFLFFKGRETDDFLTSLKTGQLTSGSVITLKNKKGRPVIIGVLAWSVSGEKSEQGGFGLIFIQPDFLESFEFEIKSKITELEKDTRNLNETRMALINILEDADEDRRKAEMERDKTLRIINNLADGLIFIEDGTTVIINPTAKNFFQTTEKEVLGKSLKDLSSHPTIRMLVEMLDIEKPPFLRKELSMGVSLKLEVSAILLGLDNKNTIIILHDITRENFIERMKTEFVSIAAHQLRTPLSAIKWILKMFLDGDMGEITETQTQFLRKTYDSNERMINLVNDLLNVTKIEEGRFLQKIQKYDMADILVEAVGTFKELAEKKGLSFSYDLPSKSLPKINVDKEKIILAIQNIIENAVFYTKFGKIKIMTDYLSPQNEFMIRVQDTGIGIPEDQKVRIFSRFFRGSTALKTETEGSGLGLFIAKNIIEAHGGKVWFDSEEGKGTTFYLTLTTVPKEKI